MNQRSKKSENSSMLLTIRKVTYKRMIENFVDITRRPFTVSTAVEETGVGYHSALHILKCMRKQNRIKVIGKENNGENIFICNRVNSTIKSRTSDDNVSTKTLELVENYIQQTGIANQRQIAEKLNLSRHTVIKCFKILSKKEGSLIKDKKTDVSFFDYLIEKETEKKRGANG